ncbi:MAG TPA: DNA replication complex GINS family protein, partial [Chromatiaceae bacterium]|nr:DNA replication complex GINS family protein [Chromatiaceae bacterium]
MLTYAVLRDIQKREMESSAIVQLQDGFYTEVAEFLSKKKEEASGGDMLSLREYENIKKIVRDVQTKREEKIVLMAIRGESTGTGLTSEEGDMLRQLVSIIDKSRGKLVGVWGSENKPAQKKVRLLKDVEQYKGLDNKVYGPFKEGEEQMLPGGEA